MSDNQDETSSSFEMLCGLSLAVLAAILAITDLGAGKFGEDEIIAHNEKANAYDWYQAKGIKQSLVEGQRDMLKILLDSAVIPPEKQTKMAGLLSALEADIVRYKKEKKEILQGSAGVGEANWALEQDGNKGRITGAEEWKAKTEILNDVGDTFDLATLFLQICLVMGAISLLLKGRLMRNSFFGLMIGLGLLGSYFTVMAYYQAGVFS